MKNHALRISRVIPKKKEDFFIYLSISTVFLSMLNAFDLPLYGLISIVMFILKVLQLIYATYFFATTTTSKSATPLLTLYILFQIMELIFQLLITNIAPKVYCETLCMNTALLLWLPLAVGWFRIMWHHTVSKLHPFFFSISCFLLIIALGYIWCRTANIALDRTSPTTISADIIDYSSSSTGRGKNYKIKIAFEDSNGNRVYHWFWVNNPTYYSIISVDNINILAHSGAFGRQWYSISPDIQSLDT